MGGAALGQTARSAAAGGDAWLWGGRLVAGAAALAAGTALGRGGDATKLVVLAVLLPLAIFVAVTRLRWCLVGLLFLLAAYAPDALSGERSAQALTAVALLAGLLRWASGRERITGSEHLVAIAVLVVAYGAATLFAGDRSAAAAETLDLVSFGALIALIVAALDTPEWLRRAVWAVVAGVGLLALVAVLQQITESYHSSWWGFAGIVDDGNAVRSAGPLNPNPFGQVLAAAAVLAFYLALSASHRPARVLAGAIALLCVAGVVYTQSRAALIALLVAALLIAVLRGVRLRVLAVAVVAAIAVGTLLLPAALQQRVGALGQMFGSDAASFQDTSLRGRTSENLAGLHMWRDNPLLGVGPDNFEIQYQRYSALIGIDPRPEQRGAHNLYLESLAETGVVGALTFVAVFVLALAGAWRARSRLPGGGLLGEGLFVALCAFLVCAFTLSNAYARYQWIFVGLALAAGRLARSARS